MNKIFDYIKHLQFLCLAVLPLVSCEELDDDPEKHVAQDKDSTVIALDEVAHILSAVPLATAQLQEVHDAVTSSSGNGYDEEYTMKNIFTDPGSGVGDDLSARSTSEYMVPLRELISEYVHSSSTRSAHMDPEAFLMALEKSDVQIYWPFSELWDGEAMPVLTYDPEDNSQVNTGYEIIVKDDGSRQVQEVVVDEAMAMERPVWVVNRNSDAGYTTLEMLRREDPDWGEGGGNIIVKPNGQDQKTRTSGEVYRMLILKEFTMKRNYDSWFAGASEFFVKIASLDDFTASTEAELQLYDPMVTDFMLVVKRNQVGVPQPFNVMLVSEMKRHLLEHDDGCEGECTGKCRYSYDEYAFMISEDDGGTRDDWTCKGKVFIEGKSYGVEVSFPLNTRDDIVWRGMLSGNSLERFNGKVQHFGDVDLTFEIVEY